MKFSELASLTGLLVTMLGLCSTNDRALEQFAETVVIHSPGNHRVRRPMSARRSKAFRSIVAIILLGVIICFSFRERTARPCSRRRTLAGGPNAAGTPKTTTNYARRKRQSSQPRIARGLGPRNQSAGRRDNPSPTRLQAGPADFNRIYSDDRVSPGPLRDGERARFCVRGLPSSRVFADLPARVYAALPARGNVFLSI